MRVVVAGYESGFVTGAVETVSIGPNVDREEEHGQFEVIEGQAGGVPLPRHVANSCGFCYVGL
jgi:hypothetical protein